MKTKISSLFVALLLIGSSGVSSAWAERILISDTEQTVSLLEPLDCYNAAQITISTSRPEIYEPAENHLQVVVDTARAMLAYECPNLSDIKVMGKIRGLDELVYEGYSSAQNQWLIKSINHGAVSHFSPDIGSNNSADTAPWQNRRDDALVNGGSLALTDLRLGMTVSEVSTIISGTFDIEPVYDKQTGRLMMHAGGCPQDFDRDNDYQAAQTEWKCLSAQFSDKRVARLEHLELVQVAMSNSRLVQEALVDKYGHPIEQKLANFNNSSLLIWRVLDEEAAGNKQIQELKAELSEIGSDRVVTILTLFNPPVDDQKTLNYADLGLQL